jgi:hypothetical protein
VQVAEKVYVTVYRQPLFLQDTVDGADWYCGKTLDLYSVAVCRERIFVLFS